MKITVGTFAMEKSWGKLNVLLMLLYPACTNIFRIYERFKQT